MKSRADGAKHKSGWTDEQSKSALRAALAGAKGDDDVASDAILRMLEKGVENPANAAGYAKNLARERHRTAARRNAAAPTTEYNDAVHTRGAVDESNDTVATQASSVPSTPPDYAAQLRAAAAQARYIACVVSHMASMLDCEADTIAAAPPSDSALRDLAWLGRLQAAFAGSMPLDATAAQVALEVEGAIARRRPPGADLTFWVVHCVRTEFPQLALPAPEAVPGIAAMLNRLADRPPTDAELAAIATALTGEPVSADAVKQARHRKDRRNAVVGRRPTAAELAAAGLGRTEKPVKAKDRSGTTRKRT